MLYWMDKAAPSPWSTGSADIHLDEEGPAGTLPVAVWCRFGSLLTDELSMLDTGSTQTVIGPRLIEALGPELGEPLQTTTLSSRLGRPKGFLHRLMIRLLAQQGSDLIIETTLVACPGWEGPTILGFKNSLDRLRFALDPGDRDVPARIHFGELPSLAPHPRRRR